MADLKTVPTAVAVADFLATVADLQRRGDCEAVCALMERVTGEPPVMWGGAIIGFGQYHYRYDSGRTGTMCRIGVAPRKADLVLYVNAGLPEQQPHLARLGKHRIGKSCLYIRRLADVDAAVLEDVVKVSLAHMAATYPD